MWSLKWRESLKSVYVNKKKSVKRKVGEQVECKENSQ